MLVIRAVKKEDAKILSSIYNAYVTTGATSYEYDAVTCEIFMERIEKYTKKYPYLVAEENGEIVGYAYASSFRERRAFDWDTEVSVYLKDSATGKGIGTKLMEKLIDILTKCNFVNAYSLINMPNEKSVSLHKKFGFEQVGYYKETGFKMEQWRDLMAMHKRLNSPQRPMPTDSDWQSKI